MTEPRQVVSVLIGLALGGTISALRPVPIEPAAEAEVPPCIPNGTVDALTNELEAVALERFRRSTETGIHVRPAPPWPQPADPRFDPKVVSQAFSEVLKVEDWKGLDCREYPCLATVAFRGENPRAAYREFAAWLVVGPYGDEGFLVEERPVPGGFNASVALPELPLSGADVSRVRFRLLESVKQAGR